jgi:hypothetical protein
MKTTSEAYFVCFSDCAHGASLVRGPYRTEEGAIKQAVRLMEERCRGAEMDRDHIERHLHCYGDVDWYDDQVSIVRWEPEGDEDFVLAIPTQDTILTELTVNSPPEHLWERWIGDRSPERFLEHLDEEIALGTYATRLEGAKRYVAYFDKRWAQRTPLPGMPEYSPVQVEGLREKLAEKLLGYAEREIYHEGR